jgi:hypothetical protein
MQQFGLGKEEVVEGTWFADTPANLLLINDNLLSTFYSSKNV